VWPHAYQTNIGIQRQIGSVFTVGAAYIGSFHRNLPFGRDVNYPVVTPIATNNGATSCRAGPIRRWAHVLLLDSDQSTDYNGLQVPSTCASGTHLVQRVLHAQQTMSSGAAHEQHDAGPGADYSRLENEYGRADTDQRHVFSLT